MTPHWVIQLNINVHNNGGCGCMYVCEIVYVIHGENDASVWKSESGMRFYFLCHLIDTV